jgi:plasmid stabilization system protein ParE
MLPPTARHDLRDAIAWIARDNPQAASGLRTAFAAAAQRIGANPGSEHSTHNWRVPAIASCRCAAISTSRSTP